VGRAPAEKHRGPPRRIPATNDTVSAPFENGPHSRSRHIRRRRSRIRAASRSAGGGTAHPLPPRPRASERVDHYRGWRKIDRPPPSQALQPGAASRIEYRTSLPARIRREHFVNGKTIREIARDLGVSRNTVRKVLRSEETSFERDVQPRPKLGQWTAELDELLEGNAAEPAREAGSGSSRSSAGAAMMPATMRCAAAQGDGLRSMGSFPSRISRGKVGLGGRQQSSTAPVTPEGEIVEPLM
jgi:transposase-like protein